MPTVKTAPTYWLDDDDFAGVNDLVEDDFQGAVRKEIQRLVDDAFDAGMGVNVKQEEVKPVQRPSNSKVPAYRKWEELDSGGDDDRPHNPIETHILYDSPSNELGNSAGFMARLDAALKYAVSG